MNLRYSIEDISNIIKAEAKNFGFCACGIAKALPVELPVANAYRRWIDNDGHASMDYLSRNVDKRLNPSLLMPGVKSIICVAMNYRPNRFLPDSEYQIAAYAYGKDYHDLMKTRLHEYSETIMQLLYSYHSQNNAQDSGLESTCFVDTKGVEMRCFCDTAPVLERYWAHKSGIGWIGKNHQLIVPNVGSMVFLGEIFINIPLNYDSIMPSQCGKCNACIKSCPTSTLLNAEVVGEVDANTHYGIEHKNKLSSDFMQSFFASFRCLSYQTIENRSALSNDAKTHLGNYIYGCDRCQLVCPHNNCQITTTENHLQPSSELMKMTRQQWHNLSIEDYQRLFKGSAVKRTKYEGLMRNISSHD